MNELINDEAVYRTAPATPGLLKKTALKTNYFWLHKKKRKKFGIQ